MQALVYIFILAAGVAISAIAYFGLTFTPIEAMLAGMVAVSIAVVMLERTLRRRSEARLERGIEDLSRLLSTDAQAGQVLSQRINEMADQKPGARLDELEADMSVLGTVVQQVAEAVAAVEAAQADMSNRLTGKMVEDDRMYASADAGGNMVEDDDGLSVNDVQKAMREGRLVIHAQPIVTLPQRRVSGYDLMPFVRLETGEYATAYGLNNAQGGDALQQRLDRQLFDAATAIARHFRETKQNLRLSIPISRATLADPGAMERVVERLNTSRAIAQSLRFSIADGTWHALNAMEKNALAGCVEKGSKIQLLELKSLRYDFADLEAAGIGAIKVDAAKFINQPESLSDYHSADVASYVARFGIDLVMCHINSEQQILSLLDDGIRFVQGRHVSRMGPMPEELTFALQASAEKIPARAQS